MSTEDKIKKVCAYIQEHLDDHLNVDLLCEIAHLSKFHFHRVFSAYTGITLIKFIQLSRLKRASYHLAFEHQLKIVDIAYLAGFDSHESFSRSFKRCFGQTPSCFRVKPNWFIWHQQFNFVLPKIENIMNVSIIEKPCEKIAYLRHQGSPLLILESAAKFIEWRKSEGLAVQQDAKMYGIPHSDPQLTPDADFIFDIAGNVVKEVPENQFGVKNSELPAGKYAVIRHIGSHDRLNDSVLLLRKWFTEQSYELGNFPMYFQYLNFISEVDEHELMTDIFLLLK
ncbi:AraC family transcriptional regulator [Acinetobacter sp. WCHAc060033]|uniref:AraC family transcriptional regulator n=1 Tax=Acinetobacter sp. WCHAc060033 TaxID=2518624 RepID=UPI001023D2F9|nr:GyrI-like domain-containing protein [Acinetobacter sp. WCHAc060033]RZG87535.1 AraC family transcriptional regulator [Acinetobacter sp. WCHAc060033]